ncbi:TonB-like protein [Sphingobium sp. SYK-6]|uniref:energy transducer TonB n=1 Tax=Sphingobium sp. (strain NBRC 103272 / SYK-6) TaxID=627192 RepID=UPI0002277A76|nr:energy transducer TonB [Sphingobium sp. SYK-6]BAK68129.1 TonB-like protein [Sphingobium sp. SYK-6]
MNAYFDPAFKAHTPPAEAASERSAYRRSRGSDSVATVGALVFGLATVGAFAFMHPSFVRKAPRTPTIVTMMELPDDPPPAPPEQPPAPETPPPPSAQVVAPVPLVVLPERPAPLAPAVATPPAPPAPVRAAPPPAPRGPQDMGDISARMISARPPAYPLASRREKEEGTVMLSVLLAIDGHVAEIAIARSSGFPRLDRAALDAVSDWRWSPMTRDGEPVMVRGVVTIPFILQRGDPGRHHRRGKHDHGPDPRDRPLSDGQIKTIET